jgi:hypothetical protein
MDDAPPKPFVTSARSWLRDYFLGDDPTFGVAIVPLTFLSMILFTRHPLKTNFIFDEQEALLANPYVRSVADPASKLRWIDAFHRDFWGLPHDRSIGSYRPLPDLVWRALWGLGAREQTPFLHHWVNVLLHGVNGALVTVLVLRWTKSRSTAWIAGALFVGSAVITEAVSGVVGIADVLGGLGALLTLLALALPAPFMPLAVFAAMLFGLYSKESGLCCVPLVPLAALLTAQITHPRAPRRWLRAILAAVACAAAFVFYVETRRRWFPAPLPHELTVEANAHKGLAGRTFAALLRWYAQPSLPRDPLNNPLVNAAPPYRIAGALRVWLRGLGQVVFPWTLSGDYSAPQEPVPPKLVSVESALGAVAFVGPLLAAPVVGFAAWRRARKQDLERAAVDLAPIVVFGLVWIVISYFPVSNVPVVLPTVRAERFWYYPILGSSIVLAIFAKALLDRLGRSGGMYVLMLAGLLGAEAALAWRDWHYPAARVAYPVLIGLTVAAVVVARLVFGAAQAVGAAVVVVFLGFQGLAARRHANDYTDDLVFWEATRRAVPRSAKAHLNYSVMLGARGNLEGRLDANKTALELAPEWPMASVYLGDTLCRLHRAPEAWPHYARGFELASNDINLLALGLQCLWDENMLVAESPTRDALDKLGEKHPGSWLEYLARDILANGETHKGVDPKYRPRGYNEGPKKED